MIQGKVPDQYPNPTISDPSLEYTVSPTGGTVLLQPTSDAVPESWLLERWISVSGVPVSGVTLSQGVAGQPTLQVFVDIGDGSNTPLDTSLSYIYRFTTAAGVVDTPPLTVGCSISLEPDHVSAILYRALQSGIAALKLPAAFTNKPVVMHAMPLAGEGTPTLPAVSFNETFLQQEEYRIGEDVDEDSTVNEWHVASQALRHYTVFVMAANVREREYYKDAVIAIYNSILGPILNRIGNNSRHRFQSTSSQVVGRANEPGFYFAEILLEFTGLYSVGISTTYGLIENIVFDLEENFTPL